jgi:phage gpG-like protein
MKYTVEIKTDRFQKMLEALRHELENPEDMLGSFGETLLRVNRDRHRAGLDPEGKPWAKLKHPDQPTGRKGGPLNNTGRMLANFHYQVKGNELRLGFDDGDGFPAIFHQEGSAAHTISANNKQALAFAGIVRKRVKHPGLPARPLVGFPESDRKLIEDVAADHLEAVSKEI